VRLRDQSVIVRQVSLIVLAAAGVLAASSCGGEDITSPTTGSIEISTATAGPEPDADGYVVTIDFGSETTIGPNATLRSENLASGNHTVHLAGLSSNCAIQGENPRIVEVAAGEAVAAAFTITCTAKTGNLEVTTTTGASADPDGYVILLDGAERGPIGATGEAGIDALPAGDHLVGLSGVAGNCQVEGDNPRTVTVTPGSSVSVAFVVTCEAPPPGAGSLRIITATTGPDPDSDGYSFAVDGGTPQPIGMSATIVVANVASGSHTVQVSGIAQNCTVQGTNPRPATVAAGGAVELRFAITCTATSGSLEVSTTTTGAVPDPDGYTISVDGGGPQPIAINGTLTIPRLAPGPHRVALGGLAANCAVDGENPRSVTIVLGQTASIRFSVSCPVAASVYRAIDLLEAPSLATGINSAGQIVGSFETSNGCNHAFLWENGVVTDLGSLGGCETSAAAINSAGQVVGQSQTSDGHQHAFRWENGVMTDLGTLGGEWSWAADINSAGQVVGTSVTSDNGPAHGFLWQDGVITDLGNLGGFPTEAHAINDAGQVVGSTPVQGREVHGFLWENGSVTDLGTLGGDYEPSHASDINNAGQVVGWSRLEEDFYNNPVNEDNAFLWEKGVMTDLGTMMGAESSRASAINASGQVVGESRTAGGETRAFLWEKGAVTGLGTLGGDEGRAADINDAGQVVGSSETQQGETRATLWIRE
jgi:probable HAF family extracellular repeat protein